jgi:hypothetical protein
MKRTRCFGGCPAYELQIQGTGDVLFKSTFPVEAEHHEKLSREELRKLVDAFRSANYYSLEPRQGYEIGAVDLPACVTSISIDGRSMSVIDYSGLQVGMPTSVRDLELAIAEIVEIRRWLPSEQGH